MFSHDKYTINKVIVDYDAMSFYVYMDGYHRVEVMFMEVESFIKEYDQKLYEYLKCKDSVEEKIYEAIDIGYDFGPMVGELLKSFIEHGIVQPYKRKQID